MTRETKVGLLFGVAVILLIGIIVSDHLSVVNEDSPADEQMTRQFAGEAGNSTTSTQTKPNPDSRYSSAADLPRTNASPTNRALPAARPSYYSPRRTATEPQAVDATRANPLLDTHRNPSNTLDLRQPRPSLTSQFTNLPKAQAVEGQAAQNQTSNTTTSTTGRSLSQSSSFKNNLQSRSTTSAPAANNSYQQRVAQMQQREEKQIPTPRQLTPSNKTNTPSQNMANRINGISQRVLNNPPKNKPVENASTHVMHTVKSNENLYRIAQKYYGNGDLWRKIAKANPKNVNSDGHVRSGIKLIIPRQPKAELTFVPVTNEGARRTVVTPQIRLSASSANTIKVSPGDTLSELSQKHLGSVRHWKKLLQANKDQMQNASDLRSGMTLKLPVIANNTSASRNNVIQRNTIAELRQPTRPVTRTQTYKVQSGDNLTNIALSQLKDGSRWREIYELNKATLDSPDSVKVGQTLKLP
ncbi:LysM peptidoglycan-binding domain-containing protein [Poriferisphaera sp. WC338]|uniref:LysM peptidoglycan-binding domain-containing protein n=1 Tax=Poriferisphaera sp. WC338 TaxID=3425129 RepID=UPI003D81275B